jgi:sensor c-di-GMP phosphodiesterase-like protein
VETREQLALLRRLGCDIAQGYLFSRPVPMPALMAWAADWSGGITELARQWTFPTVMPAGAH